jgi:hypothetical protein
VREELSCPSSPLTGLEGGNMPLELSAPKIVTFIVSVIIAVIAAVIHYAHLDIPYVHSGFTLLLVGYLVLAAGNLLRGV